MDAAVGTRAHVRASGPPGGQEPVLSAPTSRPREGCPESGARRGRWGVRREPAAPHRPDVGGPRATGATGGNGASSSSERHRGRESQPRGATGARLCSAPVAACIAGQHTPEMCCLGSRELKSKSRCGPAVLLRRPLPCSWLPVISVSVTTVPSPCKSLPRGSLFPQEHQSLGQGPDPGRPTYLIAPAKALHALQLKGGDHTHLLGHTLQPP